MDIKYTERRAKAFLHGYVSTVLSVIGWVLVLELTPNKFAWIFIIPIVLYITFIGTKALCAMMKVASEEDKE